MHPTAVAAFCRHAGQRARGGVGARDGLEVERSLSAARRGESDMASAVQKIKLSPSRDIPFNKLVLSQSNYPVVRIANRAAA